MKIKKYKDFMLNEAWFKRNNLDKNIVDKYISSFESIISDLPYNFDDLYNVVMGEIHDARKKSENELVIKIITCAEKVATILEDYADNIEIKVKNELIKFIENIEHTFKLEEFENASNVSESNKNVKNFNTWLKSNNNDKTI